MHRRGGAGASSLSYRRLLSPRPLSPTKTCPVMLPRLPGVAAPSCSPLEPPPLLPAACLPCVIPARRSLGSSYYIHGRLGTTTENAPPTLANTNGSEIPACHPAAHSNFAFPGGAGDPTKGRRAAGRRLDPTGGPVQFPAQIISPRAGPHAQIGGYGLRWPRSTHAISERSRL